MGNPIPRVQTSNLSNTTASLIKDSNTNAIQVPSGFMTVDGAINPLKSPLTLSGNVQYITMPSIPSTAIGGVELILEAETHDVKVSEDPAMGSYYILAKGTTEVFEAGRMNFIYIQGTSLDTVNFRINYI